MQLNKMQLYFIFEKTTVSKRKQKLFLTQPNITHFQTPIDVGKTLIFCGKIRDFYLTLEFRIKGNF